MAVWLGGGEGDGPGFVPAGVPTAPLNAALTVTWVAFAAVPWTRIAPFWKVAPFVGWSRVRAGATIVEIGTLITRA